MDFDDLEFDLRRIREIATVLTHAWGVPLLVLLAQGPCRFMAIKRALAAPAGRGPDSRVLKDTLERLAGQGYVEHIETVDGQPYAATQQARQLLALVRAIAEYDRSTTADAEDSPETEGPGG